MNNKINYKRTVFKSGSTSKKTVLENITAYILSNFLSVHSRIVSTSNYDLIISEIDAIYEDCKESNWDCNNALPLSIKATTNAKKFIPYIEDIKMPNIMPSPASDIGFLWKNNNHSLSIIFNDNDQIIYVKTDGIKVSSGYFEFENMEIVSKIVKDFIKNGR